MEEKKDQTAPEGKDINKEMSDKNFQVTSENENFNSNEEESTPSRNEEEIIPVAEEQNVSKVKTKVVKPASKKNKNIDKSSDEPEIKAEESLEKPETKLKQTAADPLVEDASKEVVPAVEAEIEQKPLEIVVKTKIEKKVSDESTYSLEDDNEDDDDELETIDISSYDDFTIDQVKDEAVRLLNEEEDIQKIRPAIIKLHELHARLVMEERGKIEEKDEEDEEIIKSALKEIEKKESDFDAIWNLFKEKRKEYLIKLEKEREENYNKKLALLEDLKKLLDSDEPLKKTFDEFKNIQEKWRDIGMVPKEKNNELWLNYNHYVGLFLEKVNMIHELRDLDKKKNMEIKVELCEKAEALILEKSPLKSFKKLQDLHRQWKETGPVPQEYNDELWERFKAASEKIREARIAYYDEMKKKQEANLEAKKALVEKARIIASAEMNSIKEWNAKTKEINELFELWRSIGRAPKEYNDKIWTDFKGILDAFFAARKEFFREIKQEYDDNYNKKLNICMQAEALKESTDWNKTANELKRLQAEWKKIGLVPRAKSDAIWKRFRDACDYFFDRKDAYFQDLKKNEEENYKNKKMLIEELKNHEFGDDKKANLELIHEYQRKWMEIGRVPYEKKDELQKEWRSIVDETLEKLKISRFESDIKQFKDRVEKLATNKEGQKELKDELRRLKSKIKKLEQDVVLWENNLGFFSASKNADILLKEYHDKIDKAKLDIKVMKEKEKFLSSQIN